MARDLKGPSSIINYIELVLAVVVGGLIGGLAIPSDDYSKLQVIHTAAYGYLIISIIVVASIFLKEEIPKNVRLLIAASAIIMYVTCGALLIESADKYEKLGFGFSKDWYDRTLSAGIISIALALLYIADAFFVFKS